MSRLSVERAIAVASGAFGLVGPYTAKAKKARTNLETAFPQHDPAEIRRLVRGVFRHLGAAFAELAKMGEIWDQRALRLEFTTSPAAAEYLAEDRATVWVTAHVGAWQLTNLVSKQLAIQLSTVYAEESNPVLQELLYSLRENFGASLIPTHAGLRPLIRELNAGHSVGLATDTRPDSGELMPFFGVDAVVNTTPAALALRTGAAMLPIRCRRMRPGFYRVEIGDPIVSRLSGAGREEDARDMTAQVLTLYEAWIRETPDQWICLKRRWPKPGKL
jgi:KDO2-lipid IV(A) lauroyltransferase